MFNLAFRQLSNNCQIKIIEKVICFLITILAPFRAFLNNSVFSRGSPFPQLDNICLSPNTSNGTHEDHHEWAEMNVRKSFSLILANLMCSLG